MTLWLNRIFSLLLPLLQTTLASKSLTLSFLRYTNTQRDASFYNFLQRPFNKKLVYDNYCVNPM